MWNDRASFNGRTTDSGPVDRGSNSVNEIAYENRHSYQASHPSVAVKEGICFQNEVIMSIGYTLPWAGFCALSDVLPLLQGLIGPKAGQSGCGADANINWLKVLNSWWINFEQMQYHMYEYRAVGPTIYCRVPAP